MQMIKHVEDHPFSGPVEGARLLVLTLPFAARDLEATGPVAMDQYGRRALAIAQAQLGTADGDLMAEAVTAAGSREDMLALLERYTAPDRLLGLIRSDLVQRRVRAAAGVGQSPQTHNLYRHGPPADRVRRASGPAYRVGAPARLPERWRAGPPPQAFWR